MRLLAALFVDTTSIVPSRRAMRIDPLAAFRQP